MNYIDESNNINNSAFSFEKYTFAEELAERMECISFDLSEEDFFEIIFSVVSKIDSISNIDLDLPIEELYAFPDIRKLVKDYLYSQCEEWVAISYLSLLFSLPSCLQVETVVYTLIQEMVGEKVLKFDDNFGYRKYHRSVLEIVDSYRSIDQHIIKNYLLGISATNIAKNLSLNNKDVTNTIKCFSKDCICCDEIFEEDKYAVFVKDKDLDIIKVMQIFSLSLSEINFMNLRNGKKRVCRIPKDGSFSQKVLKTDETEIRRFDTSKSKLLGYLLQKHCRQTTQIEDLIEIYYEELSLKGLSVEDTRPTIASVENMLARRNDVLSKQWRKIRYYNINEYDLKNFFNSLNLDQYQDIEITTLKLFNENTQLMKEYDIQDEYELHNLLKKTATEYGYNIDFKRTPTISFGHSNRDEQILQLLYKYAPVSSTDLSIAAEKEYGYKAATFIGGMCRCIEKFYHEAYYIVDYEALSENEIVSIKALLTDDIYLISELRVLIKKNFPTEEHNIINPYNLDQLGFYLYTDYIISKKYAGSARFFEEELNQNVIDLRYEKAKYKSISQFRSTLNARMHNHMNFEVDRDIYISYEEFVRRGGSLSLIKDFVDAAIVFSKKHKFFSVKQVLDKECDLKEKLKCLFSDWSLSTLLVYYVDEFKYLMFQNSRLFTMAEAEVVTSNFLFEFFQEKNIRSMSVDRIIKEIQNDYGLSLSKKGIVASASHDDRFFVTENPNMIHLLGTEEDSLEIDEVFTDLLI